jgi:hypothetical protein
MDEVTSKKWDALELSPVAFAVALSLTVRYDVGKPQEMEQGDEWSWSITKRPSRG